MWEWQSSNTYPPIFPLHTSLINPVPHPPEPEGSLRILLSFNSRQPLPNNLKQNQKWIFWYFLLPLWVSFLLSLLTLLSSQDDLSPSWLASSDSPGPDLPPLESKFLKCKDIPSVHWWTLKSLEQCLAQGWSSAITDLMSLCLFTLFRGSSHITSIMNRSQPFHLRYLKIFSNYCFHPLWINSEKWNCWII